MWGFIFLSFYYYINNKKFKTYKIDSILYKIYYFHKIHTYIIYIKKQRLKWNKYFLLNRGVVRWHSFQRGSVRPESYLGQPVSSMSSGQLLVLRKLALLKLTAIMEKHCPTHRTGWNWELPKFMRKMKNPDYKGGTFDPYQMMI